MTRYQGFLHYFMVYFVRFQHFTTNRYLELTVFKQLLLRILLLDQLLPSLLLIPTETDDSERNSESVRQWESDSVRKRKRWRATEERRKVCGGEVKWTFLIRLSRVPRRMGACLCVSRLAVSVQLACIVSAEAQSWRMLLTQSQLLQTITASDKHRINKLQA